MDIALLNVKITIQKNSVVVDSIGNHKNVWTDWYTCAATMVNDMYAESRNDEYKGYKELATQEDMDAF